MSIHFGTGGWRAVIGDEFTRENIHILSKAMADKIRTEGKERNPVVIGYDRRFLSKEAVKWSCEVLAAEGLHVLFVNRSCPTPLVMFYVMKHELDYGMMVTASHNPSIYNGFKVFVRGGRDADEQQTGDIERYIRQTEARIGKGEKIAWMEYDAALSQGLVTEFNPLNEYLDSIIENINMEAIRNAGLRVVLDPLYGVSQTSLQTILSTARCYMETIHERHDTLFGGKLPAPNAETLRGLQNYVVDYGYDIGVATDGDADRIGVIDDRGRFMHPNDILVTLYYYLLKYKGWHGAAVRNISTTHKLDRVAKAFGEQCYEVPVGFKYISAKMDETNALIGGESSGGLTVRGHIHGKDGVYAASLLVEMIAVTGRKISEIYREIEAQFGADYMEERAYPLTHERKGQLQEMLFTEKKIPDDIVPAEKITYPDGLKIYYRNGGWLSARFSGTEPLLRIFSEMPTREEAVRECVKFERMLGIGDRPEQTDPR